ncbi:MAG: hypothetical protein NTY20_03795 [Candidatus Aenigmarchaeota archaeon]|nr:hypothetical protein [Candidatus Aenigmarchaeota archaeon]
MEKKNLGQKESKRTVRTFAAASFLSDMGSDMIYPIWPLFVTTNSARAHSVGSRWWSGWPLSRPPCSRASSGTR